MSASNTPLCLHCIGIGSLCLGGIPKYRASFKPHKTVTSQLAPLKSSRETTHGSHFDTVDSQALNNSKKGGKRGAHSTFKTIFYSNS